MSRDDRSVLSTAYRYFLAVAEAGSMRAASRDLNIASSAVNRQILLLEDAIGMRLFERTGRKLILTETGRLLLTHVRRAAQGHGEAMSAIDALRGIRSGRIRIAAVESVSSGLLPVIVSAFLERHPGIRFAIAVHGSEGVVDRILAREADVGFTFNVTPSQRLAVVFRAALRIGAVMRRGHPLASRESLSLAACFDYPVAYPARNLSLRKLLDDALRMTQASPAAAVEATSLQVMSALARNGDTVAFQTTVGIERELADGSLVFVPLNDAALATNDFQLVRRAGGEMSPATRAFIEFATPVLEEQFSD